MEEHAGHNHHEVNAGHKHDQNHKTESHIHDKHAGHHTADFIQKFWVCLILTIPVVLLSEMIQHWFGFKIDFPGDRIVLIAFGSIIYFYGGLPFLKGMVREIKSNTIGMMTLVALAISVSFVYSVAVAMGFRGMDFFWELATLIDIMLLGHWLEMRSTMAASRALESLIALLPAKVYVEKNGVVEEVKISELREGDLVIIKPGEKIPADGIVVEGKSYIDESMLTGESEPVKKLSEDKVIAGSVNRDGSLKVRITGSGENSYLSKVINLVKSAQQSKSQTQNLADTVAKWLTYVSILVGVITFFAWYARNDFAFALERMVTVMVTSCPHALGVAIPLVVAISTSQSATHGLLIRNRTAFENARKTSILVFDKTGTLTLGSHEVQNLISFSDKYSKEQILQYAAAVQQHSEHHLAKGIIRKLKESNLDLWKSDDFHYMQGIGVEGVVNGKKVVSAGPNYFTQNQLALPEIPDQVDQNTDTINFVIINGEVEGIISFADSLRESSGQAIKKLRELKIRSFLLTGDNERIATAVSKKLGMDGYMANVLPHEKQEKLKALQAEGEIVAMTGDGVNDAPALAEADIGIAVGSGTDVAAETADIILVNSDPMDVVTMISFARATYRKMIQNLAWAVGYNVIAIPLAAGVLYPNFMLSPAMGAILMSLSTVIVSINARLLRLKNVGPDYKH